MKKLFTMLTVASTTATFAGCTKKTAQKAQTKVYSSLKENKEESSGWISKWSDEDPVNYNNPKQNKADKAVKVKTEDTGSGSTWGGSSTRSVTKPSKKEEKVYNWGDGELVKIPWPATSKKEDKVVESTKKPAYLTGESGQTEASKPAYLTGEQGETLISTQTEGRVKEDEIVKIPWPKTRSLIKTIHLNPSPKITIESIRPPVLFGKKWEYSKETQAKIIENIFNAPLVGNIFNAPLVGNIFNAPLVEKETPEQDKVVTKVKEDQISCENKQADIWYVGADKLEDEPVSTQGQAKGELIEPGQRADEPIMIKMPKAIKEQDRIVKSKLPKAKGWRLELEPILPFKLLPETISKDLTIEQVADFYENQKYRELEFKAVKEAYNFFEVKNEITDFYADQKYKQLEIKAQNAAKIYGDKMASKVKAAREAAVTTQETNE